MAPRAAHVAFMDCRWNAAGSRSPPGCHRHRQTGTAPKWIRLVSHWQRHQRAKNTQGSGQRGGFGAEKAGAAAAAIGCRESAQSIGRRSWRGRNQQRLRVATAATTTAASTASCRRSSGLKGDHSRR